MKKILLHIETSAQIGSVAISEDSKLIAYKQTPDRLTHSKFIAKFIDDFVKNNILKINQLSAVAVSGGPGSYTGLRIGVSIAKGICYALDLPLISLNTLQINCCAVKNRQDYDFIIPLMDARRDEVYFAVFDTNCNFISQTGSLILKSNSFEQYLTKGKVLFIGDGALKAQNFINNKNAVFDYKILPTAQSMIFKALDKFDNQLFENVAYFEPFYLKPFIATKPKNKVLDNLMKK